MRRIALLSISIAVLTGPGCASTGRPEAVDPDETRVQERPWPRPDLSRVLHGISDWAER
jgi:hypothetical protein